MKKTKLITFIILFITLLSYGQDLKRDDLIGKWKVTNIKGEFPPMPHKQQKIMDSLRKAFKESTFEFKSDNNFNFNIDFIEIGEMMKEVHWKYIPEKSIILIQDWKDKETEKSGLMEILVTKQFEKIFFTLSESPFTLEVKKTSYNNG